MVNKLSYKDLLSINFPFQNLFTINFLTKIYGHFTFLSITKVNELSYQDLRSINFLTKIYGQ